MEEAGPSGTEHLAGQWAQAFRTEPHPLVEPPTWLQVHVIA